MRNARALIDVHEGKLTLRTENDSVTLHLFNSLNHRKVKPETVVKQVEPKLVVKKVEEIKRGDIVLLEKSWTKMFPKKMRNYKKDPFTVKSVSACGILEIEASDGRLWNVNSHRVKKQFDVPSGGREVGATHSEYPP